jgi:chaperone modulatory protein CbpM
MTRTEITVLSGTLLEQELDLAELCRVCGVGREFVEELVGYGIIEPTDPTAQRWRFAPHCLRRVRIVLHLQRDLEVNLPGAAVALDLLDELERLRARWE